MKIMAVMTPKGGIGKTTTADTLAYILGEEKEKRVLVLEGDPQGDTSQMFNSFEPDGVGMSELLEKHINVGGTYSTHELIRNTHYPYIDIIPGNGYLMKTDINLLLKEDNQITRLREALKDIEDNYDYCICDCGRLLDTVVINILMAADLIIAPVKIGGFEIKALYTLLEQLEDLRDINPNVRIKVLMTMRQKNKPSLELEEWLKQDSGLDVFKTVIRRSVVAEKASLANIPIPRFSRKGITAEDYRGVVEELLCEYELKSTEGCNERG